MNEEVPYMPIDQFESQSLGEFIKGLENRNKDWSEEICECPTIGYSDDRDGYSHYVELVLQGMGMQKYASLFEEEDISIDLLVCLKDDDLRELGITNCDDRKCIIEHLEQFRAKNEDTDPSSRNNFDVIEDDLTIARNVRNHIVELNSYLSVLESKLSKKPPDDYLICEFETGLKFLEFTTNHAQIQINRISELLFGKQFDGRNMITSAINVIGLTLPSFIREKLARHPKRGRKLRKSRLIATVLMGMGLGMAIAVIKKRIAFQK